MLHAAGTTVHFIMLRSIAIHIRDANDYGTRSIYQPMCGGVAILDYDNDGKSDIFFTNSSELPS